MLWDGILRPGDVIDVSNIAAVKEFFNKKPGDYGEWFENNFQQCVQFATSAQEVLIKWRGRFPLKYFSVVDDVTDEDYGPLDDWVPAHHLPAIQPMPPIIFGHTKLFEVLICWLFVVADLLGGGGWGTHPPKTLPRPPTNFLFPIVT